MNHTDFLKIDGSYGEGGGQILRNCCALSHLLSQPIAIENIRKGRTVPGLRNQHLTGIEFLGQCFGHELVGAKIQSTELLVKPVEQWTNVPDEAIADTKSAGSCTLLAQMLLPVFFFPRVHQQNGQKFSEKTVLRFIGGTNVDFSPPIDTYMLQFVPMLKKHFNVSFELELVQRGYYPYGCGEIKLHGIKLNNPQEGLSCLNLVDRGDTITAIDIKILYSHDDCKSFASDLSEIVPSHLKSSKILERCSNVSINMEKDNKSDKRHRQVILIAIMRTDKDCMFTITLNHQVPNPNPNAKKKSNRKQKKQTPSGMMAEAVEFLEKQHNEGGCVDEYLQDQFIIYMALANGTSQLRTGPLTEHTRTAIHFCEFMTGAKFGIQTRDESPDVLITCNGIGMKE